MSSNAILEQKKREEEEMYAAAAVMEDIARSFEREQLEKNKKGFVNDFWNELNETARVKGYLLPKEPLAETVYPEPPEHPEYLEYPEYPVDVLPESYYDSLERTAASVIGQGWQPAETAGEGYPRRMRTRSRSRNGFQGGRRGKKRTKRYRKKKGSFRSK